MSARRQFRERRSAQVQPHFKKCFEAIDQVKFEPLEDVSELAITQMISPEKEVVPMMTPVDPVDKSVEVRISASRGLYATRLHLTRPWVVSFPSSRPFGPRRATAPNRVRMHSKSQKKPPPTSSGGDDARRPSHAAARPPRAEIRLLHTGRKMKPKSCRPRPPNNQ